MNQARFSLERRLVGRLTAILAGSFVLFTVVYLFFIQNDSVFHATEEVGELARDLGGTIHVSTQGHPGFDRAQVYAKVDWPAGAAYAAVVQSSGEVVAGSSPALAARLADDPADQLSGSRVFDAAGGLTVHADERVDSGGVRYRIAVLRPMTTAGIATIGLTHEFAEEILPSFLPTFLLASLVTWLTIRRNLTPLRRASAEASAVSVDKPGQRMGTEKISAEIRPLIDAMNRALAHLEDALSAQQRFTANAAHELRTPLAIVRARVDNLEQGKLRQALTHDVERMTRAVSQMLLTARLQARAAGETSSVDLAALARDVVADLAPLAHARSRDIALEIVTRPIIEASAPAIESAMRNLIDNAIRFTPEGGLVMVTVGPGATLSVEDGGPGIQDCDKERIFDAFWRADGQQAEGSGLGLAIVRQVAAFHAGQIRVENAPEGGARFVLSLPFKAGAPTVSFGARSTQPA